MQLQNPHVHRAKLFRIFGIGFDSVRNFLPFSQSSVPFGFDHGKMYEHVVAAFIAGDESVALFRVEPLNSTLTHSRYPLRFATDNEPLGSLFIITHFFDDCNTNSKKIRVFHVFFTIFTRNDRHFLDFSAII